MALPLRLDVATVGTLELLLRWRSTSEVVLQEIPQALRRLKMSPGFTLVAILTLTLGIGANIAMFTLLDALILRDLPVKNPNELVQLSVIMRNGAQPGLSFPAFQAIQRDSRALFSSLVAWTGEPILTFGPCCLGSPNAM